ncbi:beta-glucosidase [Nitrospirillum amazonense]|uniref:Beta-glucosidase n=1 Tax=Nitrospirillum amazonense TaxID=28077 RepID=A0A560JBJ4_9PROT|nr:beta-glucosidase [Nitrospirillum amazonense]
MSVKHHLLLSTALLMTTLTRAGFTSALAADAPAVTAAPVTGPWQDAAQSPEARTAALLKVMTREEKLQLVFGYFSTDFKPKAYTRVEGGMADSAGYIPGIARLGIPAQSQTDAGVGVATQASPTPRLRTALPSGLATAATWNPEMAFAGGAMIGDEARRSGFNVQLAGGTNLMREPRNGRNFEYGGEDPLLAGTIVGHAIKGIQSNNIISTLKHYAFNDQETSRNFIDVKVDEAAGRQSDLLAFEIALETGKPGSVMCSYNRVNGAYACENDWLLNQVLKKDWGFKGFVMSDWGATHSTAPAANAGLDQQSGYPFDKSPYFKDALDEAVNNGHVSAARLDDMAGRVLHAMFANGLFEHPLNGDQAATIDYAAHAKVTQADAEEAIVLLKNQGDVLPLAKTVKTIAIIGGHADVGVLSGGGSAQVYPYGAPTNGLIIPNEGPASFPGPMVYDPSSPLKALQGLTQAKITYIDGKDAKAAAKLAAGSDVAIVFATQWTGESQDAIDLNLPNDQDALIKAVAGANKKTVVVLENGGPVVMPWLDQVAGVVDAWYPGTSGGEAIARVLAGEVNPSGHLPVSFPASVDQLPRKVVDGDRKDKAEHPHVDYTIDGAAIGYKWHEKKGLKPLFPFGYGLSYTTFATSDLAAAPEGKGLKVSLALRNTGSRDGKAVAQVYVAPADGGWEAPKRLGAFHKVALKAGESQSVTLTVDPRLLATYDVAAHAWKIKGGDYTVMTGTSYQDITSKVTVHLPDATLPAAVQ